MLTNNNWNIFSLKTYYIKSLCHWNFAFSILFYHPAHEFTVNCPDTLVPLFFMPINSTIITFYCIFRYVPFRFWFFIRWTIIKSAHANDAFFRVMQTSFISNMYCTTVNSSLPVAISACIHDSHVYRNVLYSMNAIVDVEEKIMHNLFQIDQFPNWLLWFAFFPLSHCLGGACLLNLCCCCQRHSMSNRENICTERKAFKNVYGFVFASVCIICIQRFPCILFLVNNQSISEDWQHLVVGLVFVFFMHELFPQRLDRFGEKFFGSSFRCCIAFDRPRECIKECVEWAKSYFRNHIIHVALRLPCLSPNSHLLRVRALIGSMSILIELLSLKLMQVSITILASLTSNTGSLPPHRSRSHTLSAQSFAVHFANVFGTE